MKQVDLQRPTSLLDLLGVYTTGMQAEFEDRARTQRLARITDLSRYCQTVAWLGEVPRRNRCMVHNMEVHAKKCVEGYGELANKEIEQLYKVSTPCMVEHNSKMKNQLENCQNCVQTSS